MKNTRTYFNFHYIILVVAVLVVGNSILTGVHQSLFFILPFLIPTGIVQLITAIDYTLQDLPEDLAGDWRTYWSLTALYFVVLFLLFHEISSPDLFNFWLCVAPWFITVYQFSVVQRIYKWKSSKAGDPKNHIQLKS